MTPTPECCYCGGAHEADNCPTTYTPITDCEPGFDQAEAAE